jgi:hypothetical protein
MSGCCHPVVRLVESETPDDLPNWKVMPTLSNMESNQDRESTQAQLHEIDRGEVASWVVYPPTPAWWPVFFGLWSAALVLVIGLLDGKTRSLTQLALVVVLLAFLAWDRRRRGTYPSGAPPREFTWAIVGLTVACLAVAGLAWLVGAQVNVWAAAAIAGVGAWAADAWYEHRYAAIAAGIRERLA